jgi:hypothetical protein
VPDTPRMLYCAGVAVARRRATAAMVSGKASSVERRSVRRRSDDVHNSCSIEQRGKKSLDIEDRISVLTTSSWPHPLRIGRTIRTSPNVADGNQRRRSVCCDTMASHVTSTSRGRWRRLSSTCTHHAVHLFLVMLLNLSECDIQ